MSDVLGSLAFLCVCCWSLNLELLPTGSDAFPSLPPFCEMLGLNTGLQCDVGIAGLSLSHILQPLHLFAYCCYCLIFPEEFSVWSWLSWNTLCRAGWPQLSCICLLSVGTMWHVAPLHSFSFFDHNLLNVLIVG